MTQQEICQEIIDVIYGMETGETEYSMDKLDFAMKTHPIERFSEAFSEVYMEVLVRGHDVSKDKLRQLHEELTGLADQYKVDALRGPLDHLAEYLAE